MKVEFRRIIVVTLWIFFLFPLFLLSSQSVSSLLAFFKSRSIPVEDISVQSDSVTLKLHYKDVVDSADDDMQSHVLAIVRKVAEEWESSKNVVIEVYDTGELISEVSFDAHDAFAFARGNMQEEDLFLKMVVKEHISAEDLLSSLIPFEEMDSEKPVKTIYTSAPDLTEKESDQNHAGDPDLDSESERAEDESTVVDNTQELSQLDKTKLDKKVLEAYVNDRLTAYVGAVFVRHEGEGIKLLGVLEDSPAYNTGLQEGDVILEVENISVRDKGAQPEEFPGIVQKLPPDRPLRFHNEREGKKFDVWIKPLRVDEEQRAAFNAEVQEKFGSDYARGKQLMDQENFDGAIEYFQSSLESNSRVMESCQGLGICFFHLGRHKEARKYCENALKLDDKQPLSWFYGALNMDALNRKNGAMDGYKRYLKLNHDNAEMNAFARERLEQLRQGRRFDWNKRLLDVIDAIRKEIKN